MAEQGPHGQNDVAPTPLSAEGLPSDRAARGAAPTPAKAAAIVTRLKILRGWWKGVMELSYFCWRRGMIPLVAIGYSEAHMGRVLMVVPLIPIDQHNLTTLLDDAAETVSTTQRKRI